MTQFSVLQEAWVTCICYSSWSSSQFHVKILHCHPVHLYKYIYYYYAKELEVLWKMFHVKCCSTYVYNWVHFWFLLFPEQLLYLVLHIYFQHYPWCFYYFLSVFISYWVHLFDNIFYLMLYCLHLFHKSTPVCHTCTYTMIVWCMSFTLHIYIYEIYTLAWTVTDSYTLQSATIVIPKTILACITDICHEISAYNCCVT